MILPRKMRVARKAGKAHYYVDVASVDIYPNGLGRVRFTRRQMQQAIKIMSDYEANRGEKR